MLFRSLAEIVADCDVAVTQGQLANDLVIEVPDLPCVIDFYDPFLRRDSVSTLLLLKKRCT